MSREPEVGDIWKWERYETAHYLLLEWNYNDWWVAKCLEKGSNVDLLLLWDSGEFTFIV